MCGRFTREFTWEEINRALAVLGAPRNLQPRYNIAPTTMIDVVRLDADGKRELVPMRWGLVPWFHKGTLKEFKYPTFNARVETVASTPSFRDAFGKGRRCIIPISGFYEWTGDKKDRQPHYFTAGDGAPVMALAGLWERWTDPETLEEMLSATIVVGAASKWMSKYHDRMPMMLDPKHFEGWLDGSAGLEVLRPAAEDALREWPVSKRVNRSCEGDEDPSLTKSVVRAE